MTEWGTSSTLSNQETPTNYKVAITPVGNSEKIGEKQKWESSGYSPSPPTGQGCSIRQRDTLPPCRQWYPSRVMTAGDLAQLEATIRPPRRVWVATAIAVIRAISVSQSIISRLLPISRRGAIRALAIECIMVEIHVNTVGRTAEALRLIVSFEAALKLATVCF